MDYRGIVTVAFVIWLIWFAWRGYRTGFWPSLFTLLGLAAAYAVSFVFGQAFSAWLQAQGLPLGNKAELLAYPLLFLGTAYSVRTLPLWIFPGLRASTLPRALGGGLLGLLSGTVSGLLMVWATDFLTATWRAKKDDIPVVREPVLVQQIAAEFVARAAQTGVRLAGADDTDATVVAVAARDPALVTSYVKNLTQSEEFRELLNSPRAQQAMALNNAAALEDSEEFKRVEQLPAMQGLYSTLEQAGKDAEHSRAFVAQQTTHIWRRMKYLQNDPRVKSILEDPEFRALMEQKDPARLVVDSRFRELAAIMLDGDEDMSNFDFTQFVGQVSESEPAVEGEPKPYVPRPVYKWRDHEGRVRYSEFAEIPEHRRLDAELLMR